MDGLLTGGGADFWQENKKRRIAMAETNRDIAPGFRLSSFASVRSIPVARKNRGKKERDMRDAQARFGIDPLRILSAF